MIELFLDRYVYLLVMVLLAVGLYGVLAKGDLVKKVIGMTIFQTAIYLFFIEGSLQQDATAPVIDARGSDPALYVDPLPHLLILTAIVVGVSVVGVALALLVRIYRAHGSLDEAVIAERLTGGGALVGAEASPDERDHAERGLPGERDADPHDAHDEPGPADGSRPRG